MSSSSEQYKQQILQFLAQIPKGKICTYGDLAKGAGLPGYSRFAGAVLRKLPKDTKLPWHRIINAQGKISFPVDSEPYLEQKKRLQEEGVVMIKGKFHLPTYRL